MDPETEQNQSMGTNHTDQTAQTSESGAIDVETQDRLNEPLAKSGGVSAEDEVFLNLILKLIADKQIDLYKPSSLINERYYEQLPEEQRGKADFEAVNLLSAVRNIKDLCDAGYRETYQVQNLVQQLRHTKERLEEAGGDLFII